MCTRPDFGHHSACRHDDVIKWKHFPRYWPFVRRIHRSPVNSPHKGQWRGALMFSLICVWINAWVNNCEVGDLRRYRIHYDVTVMDTQLPIGARPIAGTEMSIKSDMSSFFTLSEISNSFVDQVTLLDNGGQDIKKYPSSSSIKKWKHNFLGVVSMQ